MHSTRPGVAAALVLLAAILAGTAGAADYPTRPIRYIVAFAPGGINDILARLVGQKLNEAWGQAVIVDNRPGAGGNLAAGMVAKSTPDGYTFMNISTAHTISQTLYSRLDYSLERDLTPVVVLANSPLIMVIYAGIPAKNLAELTDWARKNRLIYASGGVGVISHLSMEMFKVAAKIDATHVPYKGEGPGLASLVAGDITFMMANVAGAMVHINSGRLRALGVTSRDETPQLPGVPPIGKTVRGFENSGWFGIVAPTGTPKQVVDKVYRDTKQALGDTHVKARLYAQGLFPVANTPAEMAKAMKDETALWRTVVRERNIHVK